MTPREQHMQLFFGSPSFTLWKPWPNALNHWALSLVSGFCIMYGHQVDPFHRGLINSEMITGITIWVVKIEIDSVGIVTLAPTWSFSASFSAFCYNRKCTEKDKNRFSCNAAIKLKKDAWRPQHPNQHNRKGSKPWTSQVATKDERETCETEWFKMLAY